MGAQTFNRYNLFYRLERHLLLHQRGAPAKKQDSAAPSGTEAKQFEALDLPPLPARYDGLDMPKLWFLSSKGSDKKRSHRKSHGVASFTEIARIVANNWKSIDPETKDYVTAVSSILKAHAEKHGIISTSTARPKKRKSITLQPPKTSNNGTDKEETSTDDCKVRPKEKILSTGSLLPLPSLPKIIPNSIPMDIDGRSKTPRANNSSLNQGLLGSNLILPSVPLSNGDSEDLVNSVEQSFLTHVLGANVIGEPGEFGQPQTVSSLLAMMAYTGPSGRRASLPGCMPSSMPSGELKVTPLSFAQQRRASCASAVSQASSFSASRRASIESTVSRGSCQSEPSQAQAKYCRAISHGSQGMEMFRSAYHLDNLTLEMMKSSACGPRITSHDFRKIMQWL